MDAADLQDPARLAELLAGMSPPHLAFLKHRAEWCATARPEQLPPEDGWDDLGIQSGRGFGKLVCVDTPVPTPDGWRRLGDLRIGDRVFDETGSPCHILKIFDDIPEKAYRLTFSDGTVVDACSEHQWVTWTHRDRKQYLRHYPEARDFPLDWPTYRQPLWHSKGGIIGWCGPEVRTTQDIVDTFWHSSRRDTNHCVPVCGDLLYDPVDLPLDPWILGYWLGNGETKGDRISCHDADVGVVEDRYASKGFGIYRPPSLPRRDFRAIGLKQSLRGLGVFGHKHVPDIFLRGTPPQRRALLAGLLDSDGHCDRKTNYTEFCSTSRELALAVVELARSLGQKPVLGEGRAKLYGKDCGPKYRVHWRSTYQPFTLPRKAAAWREPGAQALRNRHRMIVDYEEIDPKPMRCLTVDSPNSMFLVGDGMIPTHNTRMGAEWLASRAWLDPERLPRGVIAPTQNDVRLTCFEGQSGLLNILPAECVQDYNRTDIIIYLVGGGIIRGFSAEKPDRLRGPEHSDLWGDEIAAWGKDAEDVYDMAMFGLRIGTSPRFLWTSTPKPVTIVRRLTAPKPRRIVITGSTYDNRANLSDTFLAQLEPYEGTKLGRQEIHGELIDPSEAGIVRRSDINLWPTKSPLPPFRMIILSLDTAYTEKTLDKKGDPDPTACGCWGVFQWKKMTHIMLLDAWEDHLGIMDLMRRVKREMQCRYGSDEEEPLLKPMFGAPRMRTSGRAPDMLLIEDKGSGISLRQMLAEAGIEFSAYNPGRADKLARLHIVSPLFTNKRVWVPESRKNPGKPVSWAEPVLEQLCTFAGEGSIRHDDHVDQTTQALRVAMDMGLLSLVKSKPRLPEEIERERQGKDRSAVNPYAQ